MGIYTEKGRSYSGSGVLIVEDYRKGEETIPCILVVRNQASHNVSDFGGGYAKKHKKIEVTASEELQEESRNLIRVPSAKIKLSRSFDIEGTRDTYYRVYVVKTQNVASKYFDINREVIDSNPDSTRQWKETDKIHHIPIANIKFAKLLDRQKIIVRDVHDEEVVLHMRLRKALHTGQNIVLEVLKEDPVLTKDNLLKIRENDKSFLIGTYQFAKD